MSSTPPPGAPHLSPPPAPPPSREPDRHREDEAPWRLWMAPAGIATGFGVGIIATIVVGVVAQAAGSSLNHPTPAVSLVEDFVFDLSFVAAAIYFGRMAGRLAPSAFGFRAVRVALAAKWFIIAGAGYYILTSLYATLLSLHGTDKLPSELGVHKSTAALIGAAVFVCVVAPICEETFFRGFVFGALRRWRVMIAGRDMGVWVAALITGILFGLAHTGSANAQYLIPLGFLGFMLCMIRWRTGSLYPCMALHSFNNSLALGVNELHWSALGILGLMVASLLVIASITVPLAWHRRAFA